MKVVCIAILAIIFVINASVAPLENAKIESTRDTTLVTTDNLNVRKTACTTGAIITTLPLATQVTWKGEKTTGTVLTDSLLIESACSYTWYKIYGSFGSGWSASNYLAKVDPNQCMKSLAADQKSNVNLILNECRKQGITLRAQLAYIIATTQHESWYRPIEEIGGKNKPYAPYYGRGFVQLTWKSNYEKYSKILGVDLVKNPDLALKPNYAAFIICHGMRTGTFTGKKLSDYINSSKTDFVNARRIVNGLDRADLIAGYAKNWSKCV